MNNSIKIMPNLVTLRKAIDDLILKKDEAEACAANNAIIKC